ncbi:hypothetical protein KFK09_010477 [Dendrobium nobile]|uniref:Uncharacterized protein n=1 Tax=Dendrobium nobile TaxID=94219 RepID=A0A8T3BC74_DENNO|nr:hypothetical protein KFK09_010477 [Dendrobium nobile]
MDPFPSYCSHCKSLGHSKLECPSFQPRVVVASVAEVTPVSLDSNLPSTVPPVVPVMLGSDSANVAVNNAIVSLEDIGCATHSPLCSDHVVRPVSVSPVLAGLGNVEMAVVTEVAGNANGFESVAILSPDAQPFTPTDLNLSSKRGCHSVEDPPREVPLLSVVSAQAVLASQSLNSGDLVVPFQSPVVVNLDEEVCRVAVLGNSSPIRNERVVLNDCVDVPVTYLDPKSFQYNVKDNSGVDLRVHLDWLHGYNSVSESESGSDSVESLGDGDPGNSFNLLRDKPLVTAASRGRSRGRGKFSLPKHLTSPKPYLQPAGPSRIPPGGRPEPTHQLILRIASHLIVKLQPTKRTLCLPQIGVFHPSCMARDVKSQTIWMFFILKKLRRYHKTNWTLEQENSKMIVTLCRNIESKKVFCAGVGSDFVLFLIKLLCTSSSHSSDLISPEIPICSIGNLHNSLKEIKKIFGIPASNPLEPDIFKQKSIPSSSSSPFPMLVAKNGKTNGWRFLITDDLKVMLSHEKYFFDQLPKNRDCVEVVKVEFGQEEAVVFMNAMLKSTTVLTDTFAPAAAAAKKKVKEMDAEATNTVVPAAYFFFYFNNI